VVRTVQVRGPAKVMCHLMFGVMVIRRYPDHPPRHVATDVAPQERLPVAPRYREGRRTMAQASSENTVLAEKLGPKVPDRSVTL